MKLGMNLTIDGKKLGAALAIRGVSDDEPGLLKLLGARGSRLSTSTLRRLIKNRTGAPGVVLQFCDTLGFGPAALLTPESYEDLQSATATLVMSQTHDSESFAFAISPSQYARSFDMYPVGPLCLTESEYVVPRITGAPTDMEMATPRELERIRPHILWGITPGFRKTEGVISAAGELQKAVQLRIDELLGTSSCQQHGFDLTSLLSADSLAVVKILAAIEKLKRSEVNVCLADLKAQVKLSGRLEPSFPVETEEDIEPGQVRRDAPAVKWQKQQISLEDECLGAIDWLTVLAPRHIHRVVIKYSGERFVGPIGSVDCAFSRLGDPTPQRIEHD